MIEKVYTTLDASPQEAKIVAKLNEVIENFNHLDKVFIEKMLEVKLLGDEIKSIRQILRERHY